jgi:hypothetical protein
MGMSVSEEHGASIYTAKKRAHSLILKMPTDFSKTLVPIYQTTQRYIPEDSNLKRLLSANLIT